MKFIGWIEYPSMMICLYRSEDAGFFCSKYVGDQKVTGGTRFCKTKEELVAFLMSLPSPKIELITELIKRL